MKNYFKGLLAMVYIFVYMLNIIGSTGYLMYDGWYLFGVVNLICMGLFTPHMIKDVKKLMSAASNTESKKK